MPRILERRPLGYDKIIPMTTLSEIDNRRVSFKAPVIAHGGEEEPTLIKRGPSSGHVWEIPTGERVLEVLKPIVSAHNDELTAYWHTGHVYESYDGVGLVRFRINDGKLESMGVSETETRFDQKGSWKNVSSKYNVWGIIEPGDLEGVRVFIDDKKHIYLTRHEPIKPYTKVGLGDVLAA